VKAFGVPSLDAIYGEHEMSQDLEKHGNQAQKIATLQTMTGNEPASFHTVVSPIETHRPDLGLVVDGQKISVEAELSVKGKDEIYGTVKVLQGRSVLYLVKDNAVRNGLKRATEQRCPSHRSTTGTGHFIRANRGDSET
jgi:hypothetical protein